MSQVLTVSCKLEVLPNQAEKLEAVLCAFANATVEWARAEISEGVEPYN
jgi:hypothetical protein